MEAVGSAIGRGPGNPDTDRVFQPTSTFFGSAVCMHRGRTSFNR
jgi:hypothetical protein